MIALEKIKNNLDKAIEKHKKEIDKTKERLVLKKQKNNENNNVEQEISFELAVIENKLDFLVSLRKNIDTLSLGDIYRKISQYANRNHIKDLSEYIYADYFMGKKYMN